MVKNRFTIIRILLLVSGVFLSFNSPNVELLQKAYISQVGVVEVPKGSNWGPRVQSYLESVKVYSPAPWCAGFVKDMLDSAGIESSITAFSPTAHNRKNLVYFRGKWLQPLQPGDVFTIYYVSKGRIAHTGFVNRMINSKIVETVEGNTNNDGSRDGYGVFIRRRPLKTLYSISRWQNPKNKK